MADIFISYSKIDHALALKLSAFLEAEGWSVWWDKSLGAADLYRDEIMKQLAAARAVISIWTPNSVKSDWVRAEAGAAKKEGKLIPVKTADVAYADVPLPFGEMHTENVGSTELIRAAVVAQLAKPAVEPSAVALLTKGFKYELLTWVGIVGGALTLFTNLGAVLKLADWARVLVEHWKEWTHAFWVWAFGWLGIHFPPEWTPPLSFLLFALLLAVGQAVKFKSTTKGKTTVAKYQGKSFQLLSWRTGFCLLSILAIFLLVYIVSIIDSPNFYADETTLNTTQTVAACLLLCPQVMIVLFSRHRLHAGLSVLLLFVFFWIIIVTPYQSMGASATHTTLAGVSTILSTWFIPLIILSAAPAKAISRRLIFLALGLLLLIALNELSKFGFDVTAPKQG
jgi:TIR domain-containing protein